METWYHVSTERWVSQFLKLFLSWKSWIDTYVHDRPICILFNFINISFCHMFCRLDINSVKHKSMLSLIYLYKLESWTLKSSTKFDELRIVFKFVLHLDIKNGIITQMNNKIRTLFMGWKGGGGVTIYFHDYLFILKGTFSLSKSDQPQIEKTIYEVHLNNKNVTRSLGIKFQGFVSCASLNTLLYGSMSGCFHLKTRELLPTNFRDWKEI